MNKFAPVLAALLVATGAAVAYAQPAPDAQPGPRQGWERGHRGMKGGRLLSQLNLSDAQKAQIQQIVEAQKNTPLASQMQSLRTQMREARQSGDTARVESLREQMAALRPQLEQMHRQTKEQIQAVLTPEQRAQLEQLKSQNRGRRGPAPQTL